MCPLECVKGHHLKKASLQNELGSRDEVIPDGGKGLETHQRQHARRAACRGARPCSGSFHSPVRSIPPFVAPTAFFLAPSLLPGQN